MTYPIHVLKPGHPRLRTDALFQGVYRPPQTLYVMGSDPALDLLNRLPDQALAVVGTRRPQPRTCQQVESVISWLTGTDRIIVSGLARGIDSVAHEAALAAGLPTIAILGNGPDIVYPPESAGLRQRILDAGGLILSEWPPGTEARPGYFIERNRLIAFYSLATWVAEAGVRSGALNTAKWARDHDRICFATPCFPGDPALAGNEGLINRHHAVPLWEAYSLGRVWMDLAARLDPSKRNRRRATLTHCTADERALTREAENLTAAQGGARVDALLDWACRLGWPPARFFDTLQNALDAGLLLDKNGLLLKNPALSV